ncbi:MAG TPA: trigger factor [Candidatus Saccharimonadales bacterium]|nr:trigger factor [Candidatus Saccharimonadales bacterium]
MRVTRKDNSPTNITLTVTGEAADLEPIHKHVLGHFKNTVKVPGFREGKAPLEMVEKYANQQRLLDEFMEHALNELYRRALDNEKVRPLSTPNVQLKKFVPYTELEFTAETEILGPIKLPNYKVMKLAKPKVVITAKDVNEVIESLRSRMAERVDVDRAARKGDELIIDFEGTDKKGEKINGAAGQDYPLLLGSQTFIPGFEDNLIGAKTSDTKKFEVTFPKDYGVAALQGQKVDFKVNVKKVQELKEPKVDDEFAKKAGPFKTLAELKADIKKQLTAERRQQTETEYQNELVRKIAEKTQMEVPKGLVDEESQRLEEQERQNLTYRGQTWQEHLKEEGVTEEQHRERNRPEAEERVKIGLILSEIADKEGLQVTPEELEIRRQILKGQYQDPQMQAELDKPENQRDIQARLMTEKTLERLVSYASA